ITGVKIKLEIKAEKVQVLYSKNKISLTALNDFTLCDKILQNVYKPPCWNKPLQSPADRINTMFHIKTITKLKFLIIALSLEEIKCSIDGTFSIPRRNETKAGEDPCNPLYWYPKPIPEFCNYRNMPTPPPSDGSDKPVPVPIPVPLPPPIPIPVPVLPPPVVHPTVPSDPLPPIAVPHPIMPLPIPLPFGIPLAPTNPMVPVAGIPLPPPQMAPSPEPCPPPPPYSVPYSPSFGPPYRSPFSPAVQPPLPFAQFYPPMSPYPAAYPSPYPAPYPQPYAAPYAAPYPAPYPMPPHKGIGMVPGIPGLVSPDGGVNIMPFSDAYSDMLEMHKQKMIRRRMQKMLEDYELPPWSSRRKTRRHNGNRVSSENKDRENYRFKQSNEVF
ncbi:hypothetical protein HF086_006942, partial [Spodoptera exigua]